MTELITMKRSGVSVTVSQRDVSNYKRGGFEVVEVTEDVIVVEDKKKTFSRLKVDELKALAALLNIDIEEMKRF